MHTRKNSFEDARGDRHFVQPVKVVVKRSGLKRSDLAQKDDLMSFWKVFFLSGISFAVFTLLVLAGVSYALEIWLGIDLGKYFLRDWQVQGIISFLVYGSMTGRVYSRTMWRSPQHAKAAMFRAGLCPACVYQISEVPVDADGCTICPECGVAWRMGS